MRDIDFRRDLLPLKDKLFRLALRITLDRPEAEDVVEDVLVKVWELRDTVEVRKVANLEAYCLTLTRNLAVDRARRAEAQHVSLDDEAHTDIGQAHPDTAPRPDQLLERSERQAWVRNLFDRLPTKQRTALQLRDIDEHSYAEVADIMGITESDVKITIYRARQALKALITSQPHNLST